MAGIPNPMDNIAFMILAVVSVHLFMFMVNFIDNKLLHPQDCYRLEDHENFCYFNLTKTDRCIIVKNDFKSMYCFKVKENSSDLIR